MQHRVMWKWEIYSEHKALLAFRVHLAGFQHHSDTSKMSEKTYC